MKDLNFLVSLTTADNDYQAEQAMEDAHQWGLRAWDSSAYPRGGRAGVSGV